MHEDASLRAHKSRLLAGLVQGLASGAPLHARNVASLVRRHAYDLVQQSLANPETRHRSVDERLRIHLRNVVTVLSVAEAHFGSVVRAVHWYRTAQLRESGARTAEALTAEGRVEEACQILLATASNGRTDEA